MLRRNAAILLFLAVTVAAVTPIRSYDYFWHLAVGRWIVDHHALPAADPLAVASSKEPWINGEWLYETALYPVRQAVGDRGVSVVNALLIALIFAIGLWFRQSSPDAENTPPSEGASLGASLLIAAVAFAGSCDRLGVRPSTAAALLLVIALILLRSGLTLRSLLIGYALLSVIWINVHPSALLAPLLALTTVSVDRRRVLVALTSAAALLVNPFGWKGVVAPVRLTAMIHSGEFVNAEWLPSPPAIFPLLYGTMLVAALWMAFADRHRASVWRIAVFVALSFLAVRSVRNQGLYFAALPLLLPPWRMRGRVLGQALTVAAFVPLVWVFLHEDHRPGIDERRFPVAAVRALANLHLPGNIYNVDQFGGLLEWTFYPERRALTDGRNELFREFIAEDAQAHRDSRAWRALQQRYAVTLAVDEYQSERIEVMDVASGQRRSLPASLVRYRRRDWALLAFDDAAMVFARRNAFPSATLAAHEYRSLVPDDPSSRYATAEARAAALTEVQRARREIGPSEVLDALEKRALAN